MADAFFENSDKGNRRKKTLKDKLNFKRAPLFDFEEVKSAHKLHRSLTVELAETLDRCTLCTKEPCQTICPIQYRNNATKQCSTSRPAKCLKGQLHKNKLRFNRSIEKIQENHNYQISLIDQWKKDCILAQSETEHASKDDENNDFTGKPRTHFLKSLGAGAMFLLPWLDSAHKVWSKESKLDLTSAKAKRQQEYTPPTRLLPHVWLKKKKQLDDLANKLDSQYQRKKERERELPHLGQPCSHQRKTSLWQNRESTAKSMVLPPVRKRRARTIKKTSKKPTPNFLRQTPVQLESNQRRVKFKSIVSEIIEGTVVNDSEVTLTLESPSLSHIPTGHNIPIQFNLVLNNNQPSFDMDEQSISNRPKDITKSVFADVYTACESCGAVPCLKLGICPIVRSAHRSRSKSFEYLFGIERVNTIRSRKKRISSHTRLASTLPLRPARLCCRGDGKCKACAEDQLFTREEALYRRSLLRQCTKKALELRIEEMFQKLVLKSEHKPLLFNSSVAISLCYLVME